MMSSSTGLNDTLQFVRLNICSNEKVFLEESVLLTRLKME